MAKFVVAMNNGEEFTTEDSTQRMTGDDLLGMTALVLNRAIGNAQPFMVMPVDTVDGPLNTLINVAQISAIQEVTE